MTPRCAPGWPPPWLRPPAAEPPAAAPGPADSIPPPPTWPPRAPELALWPVERRERWGRRVAELELGGLAWNEAECKAYADVRAGAEDEGDSPDPAVWNVPVTSGKSAPAAPAPRPSGPPPPAAPPVAYSAAEAQQLLPIVMSIHEHGNYHDHSRGANAYIPTELKGTAVGQAIGSAMYAAVEQARGSGAAPPAPPAPARPAIVPDEVIPAAGARTPPAPPPDPRTRLHAWEGSVMDRLAPGGGAIALPAEYAASLFGERDPGIATDPGVMSARDLLVDHIAARAPAGRRPVVIHPSIPPAADRRFIMLCAHLREVLWSNPTPRAGVLALMHEYSESEVETAAAMIGVDRAGDVWSYNKE